MFEKCRKCDFAWMALGFIVAGCLTAWVTALSIERLLDAERDDSVVDARQAVRQTTQDRSKPLGN
jgi:hypothetical protein